MSFSKSLLAAGLALGLSHVAAYGCASGEEDDRFAFGEDGDAAAVEGGASTSSGGASSSGGSSSGSTSSGGSSSGSTSSGGSSSGGTDAGGDAQQPGAPAGFPCTTGAGCASGECKAVVPGANGMMCVTPCTAATNCGDNFFCDPQTPGATAGFCVPRSPSHCRSCAQNSECGSLSETCGQAPGDPGKTCHVDCSVAGDAACPSDYTCQTVALNGASAKVCRPAGGISCLDALGGFCDRVATPQTCTRTNVAGTCVAQRTCLAASNRFSSCAAAAPVCKATCSTTDPAGCTSSYCPAATAGPEHCGACGNACPGLGKPNANVGCTQPTCSYSCQGETYDVDGNKANGCEVADPKPGNHGANTAESVGDRACYDDDSDPDISGHMATDAELHENPSIAGFDGVTGSAPDYYRIRATGQSSIFNPCVNNLDLTLAVNAAAALRSCFHLRIETNKNTYECDTDANGNCRIAPGGSAQYDDKTDIRVIVSKRNLSTCRAASSRSVATYTVKGHL